MTVSRHGGTVSEPSYVMKRHVSGYSSSRSSPASSYASSAGSHSSFTKTLLSQFILLNKPVYSGSGSTPRPLVWLFITWWLLVSLYIEYFQYIMHRLALCGSLDVFNSPSVLLLCNTKVTEQALFADHKLWVTKEQQHWEHRGRLLCCFASQIC